MIMGPGRWGTESPSLGIPVNFAEIKNVSIIGEIAEMHEGLIPDVSLGSHFFNDLVELNMLYFAIHPQKNGNALKRRVIQERFVNSITKLVPEAENYKEIVKVVDLRHGNGDNNIYIHMNSIAQLGICYLKNRKKRWKRTCLQYEANGQINNLTR